MNFFDAQERARKETKKLVIWFALCLIGVVVSMYFALIIAHRISGVYQGVNSFEPQPFEWWQPMLFLWTFLIIGGMILIGSLCKLTQLSGGGNVVARSLGGRQIDPSTTDLLERRLLNVVEEMAIASGTPIPECWVMDTEEGINAFAAGTDPANAVIGVTRGTLEQLDRNELQGVVAHEFSHILNGDMKLNMRLMGWIFGLVMISVIGRLFIESLRFMRGSRNSKAGAAILAVVVIGVAIWIIGSIGVLFARILQAAISRQREFLADASAVQFTRYPDGISAALKKIGGFSAHGSIHAAKATEARHMFFAPSALNGMLATHPPLEERIKAIEPNWDGNMIEGRTDPPSDMELGGAMGFTEAANSTGAAPPPLPAKTSGATPPQLPNTTTAATLGESGQISNAAGSAILSDMPAQIANTETTKDDAKSLLLGMLIPVEEQEPSRKALEEKAVDETIINQAIHWSNELGDSNSAQKLAMLDHFLPWLRRMKANEAREHIAICQMLIELDGEIDLFEFMLQQVIRRHIEIGIGLKPVPGIKHRRIASLKTEIANLLSLFAQLAGDRESIDAAVNEYYEHTSEALIVPTNPDFTTLGSALAEMDASTPIVKQQILRLCSLVVTHDDHVDGNELQLLRASAEAMGAQIPPIARAKY